MRSAGEMVGKERRGGQTCGQTQDGLESLKGARASMPNWTGQLVGFTETSAVLVEASLVHRAG